MDKETIGYDYLFDAFDEDRIADRCNWLMDTMNAFISQNGFTGLAYVSEAILNHVVTDYFADIKRLKDFQQIETTNHIKIFAYTVYWVLRHKPIQITSEADEKCVLVNEDYCSDLIRMFLFDNPDNVIILKQDEEAINEFLDTMRYYFVYRDVNPQCIELMMISFNAGRGYQNSADHQN